MLSPRLFEPEEMRGRVVVVIDQLRASTTIIRAFAVGAAAVAPCEEIDEARGLAAATLGSVLAGERGGVRIEGFDLGNSPDEFTDRLRGAVVVFTTTNGTRALRRCAQAERVFVGALANLSTVAAAVRATNRPVSLVCAGVEGQVCAEDALAAGAIASGLERAGAVLADDAARLAARYWRSVEGRPEAVLEALRESHGGRNLLRVGLGDDLRVCAAVDTAAVAPAVDSRGWVTA